MKYPVYCAWCGKQTGESGTENSHSICSVCSSPAGMAIAMAKKYLKQINIIKKQIVDNEDNTKNEYLFYELGKLEQKMISEFEKHCNALKNEWKKREI